MDRVFGVISLVSKLIYFSGVSPFVSHDLLLFRGVAPSDPPDFRKDCHVEDVTLAQWTVPVRSSIRQAVRIRLLHTNELLGQSMSGKKTSHLLLHLLI